MSVLPVAEDKKRLRSEMRRALGGVPRTRALEVGVAVDARLRRTTFWQKATVVAVFASLPGEVDTSPIMRSAVADGKVILLPRMIGTGRLEFACVHDLEGLVLGRFGVREPPPSCAAQPLSGSSLVLVPGLAFDRRGGRLGRGAGYYDRALAPVRADGVRPLYFGIGFALQLVDSLPTAPHDVRVDGVVTEEEFLLIGEPIGALAGGS